MYKDDQSFINSEYFSKINEFLNSRELKKLSKNLKLVFIPHARYRKYLNWFDVPNYIHIEADDQFQDVFAQSDFLITDFSSTSFEFAYMDKPTFVFVPDLETVKEMVTQYHLDAIQEYPHLIWCDTIKDVVSEIRKYSGRNQQDFVVSDKMFKYHDTDNTKRMLEWMFKQYGI